MPSVVPMIPIQLDHERHLRFDRRAIFSAEMELSRLWGKPQGFYQALLSFVVETPQEINLNNLSILVWQGLLHEDPTLTLAEVQDMLPYGQLGALVETCNAVFQAWNVATQPATEAEATPQDPSSPFVASPGAISGPLSVSSSASVMPTSGD